MGLLGLSFFMCIAKVFLPHHFSLNLSYLCSAELVQKEVILYNDLVEKYVPSDNVNSALENNSSAEEGNWTCIIHSYYNNICKSQWCKDISIPIRILVF